MATATRTVIVAICYFLVPIAICAGLVLLGTFVTGWLVTANLLIIAVVIAGTLVAIVLGLIRKAPLKALMVACAALFVWTCIYSFDQREVRRYIYMLQIKATPHFDRQCIPAGGISFNGDTLSLCSAHDFNLYGWIDFIVKIDGSYPEERLVDDLNSGDVDSAVLKELDRLGISELGRSGQVAVGPHLVSDYYLIRYNVCSNADPFC